MKSSTIKAWYVTHKWTSLVCMAFMLLLCVTGLPLIFHHEIDHALGYMVHAPEVEGASGSASLEEILEDARSRKPDDVIQFIVREPDEPELIFVRLGETIEAPEASEFYTYDARTGEFLSDYPINQGVMNVILRLHVDMFAGLPGTLFLGFMGFLLLVSIISGAVLYWPFMRKLSFGTVRRERSSRLKWLDLHNLLGVVTMVWLLIVGATGIVNTLSIPIFGEWQATELSEMIEKHDTDPDAKPGSPRLALAAAREAAPDKELSFMAFPGNSFAGPRHYVAYMQGDTPWSSRLLTPILVDGREGKVLERGEMPWYVSALLISQPLHFGDYGGMPLKVAWALLDILSIFVLISGLYLWLLRYRRSFDAWWESMGASDSDKTSEATT